MIIPMMAPIDGPDWATGAADGLWLSTVDEVELGGKVEEGDALVEEGELALRQVYSTRQFKLVVDKGSEITHLIVGIPD